MRAIMEILVDDPKFRCRKEEWCLIGQLCEFLDGKDLYDVIEIKKKINIILDAALIETAKKEV